MRLLRILDHYILKGVAAGAEFLLEWFSITQKMLELGCVVAFVVFGIATSIFRHAGIVTWMLYFMALSVVWGMHRKPIAVRSAEKSMFKHPAIRLTYLVWPIADIYFRYLDHGAGAIADISIWLFLYLYAIHTEGKRGRKRKLALGQIKELFGLDWMTKPLPQVP